MATIDNMMVSVVIPCLNRASFLIPTIESVLHQEYPHIECIVVDGGSTDGTLDILRNYGNRIKWISERDKGHADAINKGWRMSHGEVLAWLNADDVWVVPNAVREIVRYFKTHSDVDVVYGNCGSIDESGNVVGMSYAHDWNLAYAVEHCDHCIPQPAAFIRRRILDKVGFLDASFYQKKDHELWLRIGLVGKIEHLPILIAHARNVKGLSFDGETVVPSCVQVTKKFFSLPNVPPSIVERKCRAISNSYAKGMHYAAASGCWRLACKYSVKGIMADPFNVFSVIIGFASEVSLKVREKPPLVKGKRRKGQFY